MSTPNALPMAIPTIAPLDSDVEPWSPDDAEVAAAVEAVAVRNTPVSEESSLSLAAKRSSAEQPALQGFEAQHPRNGGSALEQVYHELELYGETQLCAGMLT